MDFKKLAEDLIGKQISVDQFVAELEEVVDRDGLIQSYLTSNGFERELNKMIGLLKRLGNLPATLLALDIDHLKQFNDTFGHLEGDKLIKTYAKEIEQITRFVDVKGRLGGDEFAVFLIGTDLKNGQVVAERIRTGIVSEVKKTFPNLSWEQTVSIGITEMQDKDNAQSLRERADQALYEAKKERNKIVTK